MSGPLHPDEERERRQREADDRANERAMDAEHEQWQRDQDYERDIAYWWDDEA